jgi:hypothetical protein
MANGVVHRAGPADQGFGSTHVILKVVDPTDSDDLFLVYRFPTSFVKNML